MEIFSFIETSAGNIINFITNWIYNTLSSFLQGITLLPIIGIYIVITILSTYFICTDRLYILDQLEHHFPKLWVKKLGKYLRKIIKSLGNYLKAESILILISFICKNGFSSTNFLSSSINESYFSFLNIKKTFISLLSS